MMHLLIISLLLIIPPALLQNQDCPDGVTVSLTRPDSVLEDGLAVLTCAVTVPSGTTLPSSATWDKDYLPLDTSDSSVYSTGQSVQSDTRILFELQILQAEVEDSGVYSCDPVVSGALCRDSVNLTVNYALAVIVEDQDTLSGEDARLVCLVRGDNPSAVWYRYNETSDLYTALDDSSGKYSFSQEGSEFFLSFSSASSEDTGVYRCEGRSPTGRVEEDFNFYALIAPSATQIRGGNNDGEFVAFSGDNIILDCDSDGVRAPQYNWTINDVILEEDTDKLIFNRTTGQLTIAGATKFEEGTYTCVSFNKAGTDSAQVIVIIHIVATIVDQVNAVSVGLGDEAILTVTLSASPPIDSVQWTVSSSSTPLVNSTKHTFYLDGTLIISDVTEADDTTYKLKACNTISSLIKCAQSQAISVLVILPPPAPTDLTIESEDTDASSVQISWSNPATNTRNIPDYYALEVRTNELAEYTLLDEEIPVSSFSGYTLTRLFSGYVNYFRIRGSNLGGLGTPSNELNATISAGVPRIRSVSAEILSSTSLNVTFVLWHDGGESLTSLFLQYKENTSSSWNNLTQVFEDDIIVYYIVIENLASATYYDIRLQVSNELGASDFFQPEEMLLPDSLPGTPVLTESDTRLDSVDIAISLDDFGTGELLGFFVKYVLGDNETIEEVPLDVVLSPGQAFTVEITGLQGEVTYIFSAAGNSTIGLGPYSSELNIYTDTKFYEQLYFKITVGVAAILLISVLVLLCLAVCVGCLCFKYGKKIEYSHIYKTRGGAENYALTEDGPDANEYPQLTSTRPLVSGPTKVEDSFSERSTPPVIPPRKATLLDDLHTYDPSPPLAGYSSIKNPKRHMMEINYPSDPFGDFPPHKNFLGQDKPPNRSLGNISQGSYITDV